MKGMRVVHLKSHRNQSNYHLYLSRFFGGAIDPKLEMCKFRFAERCNLSTCPQIEKQNIEKQNMVSAQEVRIFPSFKARHQT